MSNIDKQALLVSKAKASVFTMEYISQFEASDIDSDDVDLRFEVDGVETGTTVSIVDECGHAAQIITALLDELEHYKSREERVTKLVLDNSTSWDVLYEKLAAAERRIAELERTEIREDGNQFLVVRHPGKLPVIKHCVGELEDFLRQLIERDSLVTIDIITHRYYGVGGQWVQDADEYLQMMQGAGIGVKQQEDSVDSDVGSRNQPGMVVAVHIGAGDFVKVKGQVFEVEETDFDDHDVTLWFVGGNALKCADGCPVEVVSAPVAAGIKVKGE
ncbi:ead/Ea22-like family protein [Salmonella enterica subsp. enterica serovar Muenchen]|nr:ead/Ea22-like family protein [Salmonella enterica subsp. enterica serovar Muenchen]